MVRTIINKLSTALLALLLFASCDKGEYNTGADSGANSGKIRFEIAVGTATATSSGVQTRVATSTDGNYTSTFSDGDEVGVYIVKGSGGLRSSGNWVDNMKMTYNNGNWTYTFPSGRGYYPADGDKLSFYAYYPYNLAVTDALNMRISGITDQSSAANLSKSDMLSASTLNVGKNSNPVQLTFSHVMAMIELTVNSGGAGGTMSSEVTVTTEVCIPDASFNLSTGEAYTSGTPRSVKMYRVEQPGDIDYYVNYTYRVLVPTQTVPATSELFRFSRTQGSITRFLSHKPGSNVALWPGQVKPYTVTLQGASSTHTYAVGDYYPYKGFPILGVVFETSNGGKNGKIIDLNSIQRYVYVNGTQYDLRWGDPNVNENAAGVVGIRDATNGYNGTRNLIIKYKNQPDFANVYCVFNWIYQTKNNGDVNGMWYLPAANELNKIMSHRNTINPIIKEAGGDEVVMALMSSTEHDAAYQIFVGCDGVLGIIYKKDVAQWSTSTFAVGKF